MLVETFLLVLLLLQLIQLIRSSNNERTSLDQGNAKSHRLHWLVNLCTPVLKRKSQQKLKIDNVKLLCNSVNVHLGLGEYEKAYTTYEKRHISLESGSSEGVTFVVTLSGLILKKDIERLHSVHERRVKYKEALNMMQEINKPDKNADLVRILAIIGDLHCRLGNKKAADSKLQAALNILLLPGDVLAKNQDASVVAGTLDLIGKLHHKLGYIEGALSFYEQALKLKKQTYGADSKNMDMANTLIAIANLDVKLENFEDERNKLEEALEMQLHVFGKDTKNTQLASTMNKLGASYHDMGDFEKAQPMFEKSLAIKQHVYGNKKNFELAISIHNLGEVHFALGDYRAARIKYAEALDMITQTLGSSTSRDRLMEQIRTGQKKKSQAERLISRVTLSIHCNDVYLYLEGGEYEKAHSTFEKMVALKQHTLKFDEKDADLAETFILKILKEDLQDHQNSKYEEAVKIFYDSYATHAKNAELIRMLYILGNLHARIGNKAMAGAKLMAANSMILLESALVEKDTMYLIRTAELSGSLHRKLGLISVSRTLFETVLEYKRQVYGIDAKNVDMANTLLVLASLDVDLERNYAGEQMKLEEALEMQLHVYGKDAKNAALAKTLNRLGVSHYDGENYEKARVLLQQSLEMKQRVYGTNSMNSDLAVTLNNLGEVHRHLGNFKEARANLEKALKMMYHFYGDRASGRPDVKYMHNDLKMLTQTELRIKDTSRSKTEKLSENAMYPSVQRKLCYPTSQAMYTSVKTILGYPNKDAVYPYVQHEEELQFTDKSTTNDPSRSDHIGLFSDSFAEHFETVERVVDELNDEYNEVYADSFIETPLCVPRKVTPKISPNDVSGIFTMEKENDNKHRSSTAAAMATLKSGDHNLGRYLVTSIVDDE